MIKSFNLFSNKSSRHNSFQSIVYVCLCLAYHSHCNETKRWEIFLPTITHHEWWTNDTYKIFYSIHFSSMDSVVVLFLLIAFKVVFARLRNDSHLSMSSIVDSIIANYSFSSSLLRLKTPCFEHFEFFA